MNEQPTRPLGWDTSQPVPVYYFNRVKPTPKAELLAYLPPTGWSL